MKQNQEIFKGIDGVVNDVYGFYKRQTFPIKTIREEAVVAHQISLSAASFTDDELDIQLSEHRSLTRLGRKGHVLLNALGLIGETSFRIIGIRPFQEQIMGALAILQQCAIQMQTGEGKTITAVLAAVLAAWKGGPCHIVTANDYLAKRDAEFMQPLYERCGLSVGHVIAGMEVNERKYAYDCDITYSTSKELLADFLRDKIADEAGPFMGNDTVQKIVTGTAGKAKVMRGLNTAIIDEADSVLADEATVPLIISMPGENRLLKEAVTTAFSLSGVLNVGADYIVRPHFSDVEITSKGKKKILAEMKQLPAILGSYERSEYLLKQALVARHFYHKDVHYVIHEEKIIIVDEKTGRMMDGRSWSGGLHQAIEAKEGIEITDPTHAHIQMSFQLFFRLYKNLSGMSGTLQNIEKELWNIYGLAVVKIPTHLPKKLALYREKILPSSLKKWDVVTKAIIEQVARGKAVLVGTRSIKESEILFENLQNIGINATVLNAVRHEQEAEIIEQAGQKGKVTIATNMAGRGTDIIVDRDVLDVGGLHVVATERHESRRVDMQLLGRTARQGLPGSAQRIVCLDDEVLRKFSMPMMISVLKKIMQTPFGERICLLFYILFQYRAEKSISRLRKKILEQDLDLSKALSFTKY